MRRNDREVTEETEIRKVLDECKIVHLGFQDGGRVFVVPVNYGYSYEEGKLTVYFHGADAGLKRELAESNPVIGFEIDSVSHESAFDAGQLPFLIKHVCFGRNADQGAEGIKNIHEKEREEDDEEIRAHHL